MQCAYAPRCSTENVTQPTPTSLEITKTEIHSIKTCIIVIECEI